MKRYFIYYSNRCESNSIHNTDNLDDAIKWADEFVKGYEKAVNVDIFQAREEIFKLEVNSFDEEAYQEWEQTDGDYRTMPEPNEEYSTAYYYGK